MDSSISNSMPERSSIYDAQTIVLIQITFKPARGWEMFSFAIVEKMGLGCRLILRSWPAVELAHLRSARTAGAIRRPIKFFTRRLVRIPALQTREPRRCRSL